MATLRQYRGISGFPRRSESEYDTFGTAHSSTSISAALGMAVASRNKGEHQRQHIAVIGDGAMSAGMAFEAMNNAGVTHDINMLVILNDNEMSISPPVGALHRYLTKLMSGNFYAAARSAADKLLKPLPPLHEFAKRFEEHTKGMLGPGTIFEEFGFNYLGPIDGHDLDTLTSTLRNIKQRGGLQFLHVVTKKGAGYKLAEADPVLYHGPGKFDPAQGIVKPSTPGKITYTQVFGDWVCDMAAHDTRLVAITPAMREGSGLVKFEQHYPQRYFDVGIAEQHAITFAAGLACEGLKPVVAIYSTFLQRGYDQLIHDVALQNLDVTLALDRAGIVGADGATHMGAFDIAFLRCLPYVAVLTPADENECRQLLTTAYQHEGTAAVRYPRGSGPGTPLQSGLATLPWGKGEIRRQGKKLALLAFGTVLQAALQAGEVLGATVANMRFVKPLDTDLLTQLAQSHDYLVTIEEGVVMGGAGSAVLEYLSQAGLNTPVLTLGLPDEFVDHGDQVLLMKQLGLDAAGIQAAIEAKWVHI
jgi:1-deoxy-D-xylulose-5-phosphate synthase